MCTSLGGPERWGDGGDVWWWGRSRWRGTRGNIDNSCDIKSCSMQWWLKG